MVVVEWPSITAKHADVWRVLDLCGLTRSVRESKRVMQANLVYLNGLMVTSMKEMVAVGKNFRLEIRYPDGKIRSSIIRLIPRVRPNRPRQTGTRVEHRRG